MTDRRVIISETPDEIEEEIEEEVQPAPPGVAYVGECAAHPGDGTAWIGDIVVSPEW